jgi:predicted HTH domain antitoxin
LGLLAEGRVSVGRAAELLQTSVRDVMRLAEQRGVEIGATAEQYRRSREGAGDLLRG